MTAGKPPESVTTTGAGRGRVAALDALTATRVGNVDDVVVVGGTVVVVTAVVGLAGASKGRLVPSVRHAPNTSIKARRGARQLERMREA